MHNLLILWRRNSLGFSIILTLATIVSAVIFRHPLFWEGMEMLKDPQQRMMLLQWSYFPSLYILFGGMQVVFMGILLLCGFYWLISHNFQKQSSRNRMLGN
jgi:hypothetical protein